MPIEKELNERLKVLCDKINQQNFDLMARIDAADFDPGRELDNTRNGAGYALAELFGILKCYRYGSVPTELTDAMVSSTDQLIEKIQLRYGEVGLVNDQAIKAGHAFRRSKAVWRITRIGIEKSQEQYHFEMDTCLTTILNRLDDLNFELDRMSVRKINALAQPENAAKKNLGKRTAMQERQLAILTEFLQTRLVTPSMTVMSRTHQCWMEHAKEWDEAGIEGRGYSHYKSLARAYENWA